MPSLTARRHRQTRDEIAAAATELFVTRGYESTTMDEIASAAGVSRRTAYRHFAHKHELVFHETTVWLDHFDEILATRPPDESTRDLCRRGLLSVAELIEQRHDRVEAGWSVIVANPSLRGRLGAVQDPWFSRYLELILADTGSDPDHVLNATILAGTLVATTNALVAVWADQQPNAEMVEMTVRALDYIDNLWPAATREASH